MSETIRQETVRATAHKMARHGWDFVDALDDLAPIQAIYVGDLERDGTSLAWTRFRRACERRAVRLAYEYGMAS